MDAVKGKWQPRELELELFQFIDAIPGLDLQDIHKLLVENYNLLVIPTTMKYRFTKLCKHILPVKSDLIANTRISQSAQM